MSRRDTIIIAVLVNAGLLLVLFATALPSTSKEEPLKEVENAVATVEQPVEPVKESIPIVPADEVDQVLSEWNIKPSEEAPQAVAAASESSSEEETKAEADESDIVIVKRGDVLEKIAKAHGMSSSELAKLNGISVKSTLKIGQELRVSGKAPAIKEKKNKVKAQAGAQYYTVKKGDSPWKIAKKNNIELEELLKLNDLDEEKARKLKAGDRLRIK